MNRISGKRAFVVLFVVISLTLLGCGGGGGGDGDGRGGGDEDGGGTPIEAVDTTPPTIADGGVSATNIQDVTLILRWVTSFDDVTASSDLQYSVYWSDSNNIDTIENIESNGTLVIDNTLDITFTTITGLYENTTYYFNVVVQDEAGHKSVYNVSSYTTLETSLPLPDSSGPVPGGSGTINPLTIRSDSVFLSWILASDDVTTAENVEYLVYQSLSNNIDTVVDMEANGTPLGSYALNITRASITGLSPAVSYYFNIIVRDQQGNQSSYNAMSVLTPDTTYPIPGDSGIITISNVTESSLDISWSAGTDDATTQTSLEYLVYRSTSSNIHSVSSIGTNGTPLGVYAADITSGSDTGLSAGTTYYYNVIIRDASDNRFPYRVVEVTTPDNTAPTSGSSGTITATDQTIVSLRLNWTAASDIVSASSDLSYHVYRSNADNIGTVSEMEANGTHIGSPAQDVAELTVSGLSVDSVYYFNLIVEDEAGNKAAYNRISASTVPDTTPPVPGDLGIITSPNVYMRSLSLSWTVASDTVSSSNNLQYLVYMHSGEMSSVDFAEEYATPLGDYEADIDSKEVINLLLDSNYTFNVIVKDENDNKSIYASSSFTTNSQITAWDFVDGDGVNGINLDPAADAEEPQLTVFNSKLYATWCESSNIKVAVYNSNDNTPTWAFVGGDQFSVDSSIDPQLTVFDSKLYITYRQNEYGIKVLVYNSDDNSPAWTEVGDSLFLGVTPQITVFDYKLYIIYEERYQSTTVFVYNADDSSPSWSNVGRYLEYDTNYTTGSPQLTVLNSVLYATWSEGGIRVAAYNGDDDSPNWSFVDGNVAGGIRKDPNELAGGSQLTVFDSKLYAIWNENHVDKYSTVRAAVYNSPSSWNFVDGHETIGIHFEENFIDAGRPQLTAYDSKLYAICVETSFLMYSHVRVKVFNGDDLSPEWTPPGTATTAFGLNHLQGNAGVMDPQLTVFDEKLYAIWSEDFKGNTAAGYNIRVAVGK